MRQILPLLRNTDDFANKFREMASRLAQNHRCHPGVALMTLRRVPRRVAGSTDDFAQWALPLV